MWSAVSRQPSARCGPGELPVMRIGSWGFAAFPVLAALSWGCEVDEEPAVTFPQGYFEPLELHDPEGLRAVDLQDLGAIETDRYNFEACSDPDRVSVSDLYSVDYLMLDFPTIQNLTSEWYDVLGEHCHGGASSRCDLLLNDSYVGETVRLYSESLYGLDHPTRTYRVQSLSVPYDQLSAADAGPIDPYERAEPFEIGEIVLARRIIISGEVDVGSRTLALVATEEIVFEDGSSIHATSEDDFPTFHDDGSYLEPDRAGGQVLLVAPRIGGTGTIDVRGQPGRNATELGGVTLSSRSQPGFGTAGGALWIITESPLRSEPAEGAYLDTWIPGGNEPIIRVASIPVPPGFSTDPPPPGLDLSVRLVGGESDGGPFDAACMGSADCRSVRGMALEACLMTHRTCSSRISAGRSGTVEIEAPSSPLRHTDGWAARIAGVQWTLAHRTYEVLLANGDHYARLTDPGYALSGSMDGPTSRSRAALYLGALAPLCPSSDLIQAFDLPEELESACTRGTGLLARIDGGMNYFGFPHDYYAPIPVDQVQALWSLSHDEVVTEHGAIVDLIARFEDREWLTRNEIRDAIELVETRSFEADQAAREAEVVADRLRSIVTSDAEAVQRFGESTSRVQASTDRVGELLARAENGLEQERCDVLCVLGKISDIVGAASNLATVFSTALPALFAEDFPALFDSVLEAWAFSGGEVVPLQLVMGCPVDSLGELSDAERCVIRDLFQHARSIYDAVSGDEFQTMVDSSEGLLNEVGVIDTFDDPVLEAVAHLSESRSAILAQEVAIEGAIAETSGVDGDTVVDKAGALAALREALATTRDMLFELQAALEASREHTRLMTELVLLGNELALAAQTARDGAELSRIARCRLGAPLSDDDCTGFPSLQESEANLDTQYDEVLGTWCRAARELNDRFLLVDYLAYRAWEFADRTDRDASRDPRATASDDFRRQVVVDPGAVDSFEEFALVRGLFNPSLVELMAIDLELCARDSTCMEGQLTELGISLDDDSEAARRLLYFADVLDSLRQERVATFTLERRCGQADGHCSGFLTDAGGSHTGLRDQVVNVEVRFRSGSFQTPINSTGWWVRLRHAPDLLILDEGPDAVAGVRSLFVHPDALHQACASSLDLFFPGTSDVCRGLEPFVDLYQNPERRLDPETVPFSTIDAFERDQYQDYSLFGVTLLGHWTVDLRSTYDSLNNRNSCHRTDEEGRIDDRCLPSQCVNECFGGESRLRLDPIDPAWTPRCSCYDDADQRVARPRWESEETYAEVCGGATTRPAGCRGYDDSTGPATVCSCFDSTGALRLEANWLDARYSSLCDPLAGELSIRRRFEVVDPICEIAAETAEPTRPLLAFEATCAPYLDYQRAGGINRVPEVPLACDAICGPLCRNLRRELESVALRFFVLGERAGSLEP